MTVETHNVEDEMPPLLEDAVDFSEAEEEEDAFEEDEEQEEEQEQEQEYADEVSANPDEAPIEHLTLAEEEEDSQGAKEEEAEESEEEEESEEDEEEGLANATSMETPSSPVKGADNPQQATPPGSPIFVDDETMPTGEMTDIYVRHGREQFTLKCDLDEKIFKIKQDLEKLTGVPAGKQKLIYNSFKRPFKDEQSLRYYRCLKGAFFTMSVEA